MQSPRTKGRLIERRIYHLTPIFRQSRSAFVRYSRRCAIPEVDFNRSWFPSRADGECRNTGNDARCHNDTLEGNYVTG